MNRIISEQADWDELLEFVSEKNLTPILGEEMYKYADGDVVKPLDNYLAQKILDKNNITDFTTDSLTKAFDYLKIKEKIDATEIIESLRPIVKGINFELPLLNEFLTISDLNYFINTTVYNNLLENQISKIRNEQATSCNYSIQNQIVDFPVLDKMDKPHIFNVFGSLLKTSDLVALSEEDLLEYASTFNSKMTDAINIMSALKNNHLLFLGCTFPDWMERFAMRLLTNQPLHQWSSRKIILINDPGDSRVKDYAFLKNYRGVVTFEGTVDEFVHELNSQWVKRNPNAIKKKSIFLSYTREDEQAVLNLKAGLEESGKVVCWYDKHDLNPGVNWEQNIAYGLREADLFIPLISKNSLDHEDGYVQVEWVLGKNESFFKENYLMPVVIDNGPLFSDEIAKHFDPKINVTKLPDGKPGPEFIGYIKKILNVE